MCCVVPDTVRGVYESLVLSGRPQYLILERNQEYNHQGRDDARDIAGDEARERPFRICAACLDIPEAGDGNTRNQGKPEKRPKDQLAKHGQIPPWLTSSHTDTPLLYRQTHRLYSLLFIGYSVRVSL